MNDPTLDTYNKSAKEMADYFKGIGTRIDDIEKALELAGKTDGSASVLEIGCGDGRDAEEIVKRAKEYLGLDYSQSLLHIATERLPQHEFLLQDMLTFAYPKNSYDIVFAFASLLHISKEDIVALLPKIAGSLHSGGIFYVSLKYTDEYSYKLKEDQFGKRMFYFYNPDLIEKLSQHYFEVVHTNRGVIGHTQWFEMALKKKQTSPDIFETGGMLT